VVVASPVAEPGWSDGAGRPCGAPVRASREVRSTAGRCVSHRSAGYRFTRSTASGCFHPERPLPRPTVPRSCYRTGSFPRAVRPLRSSFVGPPGGSFRSCPSCLGLRPLRGVIGGVHLRAGMPAHATVRPQVFSTSRRLAPPLDFAGLFHPAATSRVFTPFRGFSPPAAVPTRRRDVASLPLAIFRSPRCSPDCSVERRGCHVRPLRLRGLAPRVDAFLGWGV
jgi:hypothetical protein